MPCTGPRWAPFQHPMWLFPPPEVIPEHHQMWPPKQQQKQTKKMHSKSRAEEQRKGPALHCELLFVPTKHQSQQAGVCRDERKILAPETQAPHEHLSGAKPLNTQTNTQLPFSMWYRQHPNPALSCLITDHPPAAHQERERGILLLPCYRREQTTWRGKGVFLT